MGTDLLAAQAWPSNAELIADVCALHAPNARRVLDLTYGRGVWWKRFQPAELHAVMPRKNWTPRTEQLFRERQWVEHVDVDFRAISEDLVGFDLVGFDPPYVSTGGRATSTVEEFNDRYGLVDATSTPRGLHEHNVEGLRCAVSACRPGGVILVKCMDYISSGKPQKASRWMFDAAIDLGLEELGTFFHIRAAGGMQPTKNIDGSKRRQVHARNNLSFLFAFSKPIPRRRRKTHVD